MREISQEELLEIISKHEKWLRDEEGGERADLRSADLRSADLRYADLSSADLRSADLRSADLRYADLRYADLSYANLRSADLSSANLRSADLSSANLRSADLRSADLRSADLCYANLRYAFGQYFITQRSDGYQFFLVKDESERWMIRAGCQYMSIEDYRTHTAEYSEESKKVETNLILDFAEAKLNSLGDEEKKAAA